jgi:hypothetical protein
MASASIRFAESRVRFVPAGPHRGRMDDLDAARGIVASILLALPLWAGIILLLSTVLD